MKAKNMTGTAFVTVAFIVFAALHPAAEGPARKKTAARKSATAADHKKWMDDATDLQEDLRETLATKVAPKAATAATKLAGLMAKTQTYWASKRADDIVKLAADARAQAQLVASAAKGGHFDQANEAFDKMNTTCSACHNLHPEER